MATGLGGHSCAPRSKFYANTLWLYESTRYNGRDGAVFWMCKILRQSEVALLGLDRARERAVVEAAAICTASAVVGCGDPASRAVTAPLATVVEEFQALPWGE
jgi:hypothetical protein